MSTTRILSLIYLPKENGNDNNKLKDKDGKGPKSIFLPKNIYSYYEDIFPQLHQVITDILGMDFVCQADIDKQSISIHFNDIGDVTYVDISASCKSEKQCIVLLEKTHDLIQSSDIVSSYNQIVSYNPISEYYCKKLYPIIATIERKLRRLLLNVYVANFKKEYSTKTIDSSVRKKVKKNIKGGHVAEKLNRNFFGETDLTDLENILFTPCYNPIDTEQFLSEHKHLSQDFTDEQLTNEIRKLGPKTDWERLFSDKSNLKNPKDAFNDYREARNEVAHSRNLTARDYRYILKKCRSFEKEIDNEIKLTETKDFAKQRDQTFRMAVANIFSEDGELKKTLNSLIKIFNSNDINSELKAIEKSLDDAMKAYVTDSESKGDV